MALEGHTDGCDCGAADGKPIDGDSGAAMTMCIGTPGVSADDFPVWGCVSVFPSDILFV